MYEAPRETKKSYRAPPQDSFDSPSTNHSDARVEARNPPGIDEFGYIGSTLIGSGVEYYSAGEYAKALKAFTTALKTQRVSIGDEDICIALTLGNLGAVHLQQGNLDEAESVLLESLLMKRRLKPQLIVADTLNNLGNCANLWGDYRKSLEYYREALEDLRNKQGRPEDLANTLFNLGRLEIQQQGWDTAMAMLTEALRVSKEIFGVYHSFVAQTLDLIGFVQLSTSDLDAAIISFTKALGIFRRLHGPLHVDVANSLFNVGTWIETSCGPMSEPPSHTCMVRIALSFVLNRHGPGGAGRARRCLGGVHHGAGPVHAIGDRQRPLGVQDRPSEHIAGREGYHEAEPRAPGVEKEGTSRRHLCRLAESAKHVTATND
jgi:Tetratricopeptide repeat